MESGKITKIALLIVTMLIITISSVISTGVMYNMLMEERNKQKNNTNIIIDEDEEINYNIDGTYTFSEPESEKLTYEFSDGKVKFESLYMTEGTYEINDDIITITYEKSYDPEGNEIDSFPNGKEEELIIVDDNTIERESEINGKIVVSQYIKTEGIND